MASLYLLNEADEIGSDTAEAHRALGGHRLYCGHGQLAERAWRLQRAVQTYRAENPDLLEEDCSPGRRPDHLPETAVN
jgi:hypothetical protein